MQPCRPASHMTSYVSSANSITRRDSFRTVTQALADRLRPIVGSEHFLQGERMDEYGHDATFMEASALCVVRPADTEQVAVVVRECAAERVPVVARGRGTSLVSAPVPIARAVRAS